VRVKPGGGTEDKASKTALQKSSTWRIKCMISYRVYNSKLWLNVFEIICIHTIILIIAEPSNPDLLVTEINEIVVKNIYLVMLIVKLDKF
jgi:hypothetical protein